MRPPEKKFFPDFTLSEKNRPSQGHMALQRTKSDSAVPPLFLLSARHRAPAAPYARLHRPACEADPHCFETQKQPSKNRRLSGFSATTPILCKARNFLLLFVIVSIRFVIDLLYNPAPQMSTEIYGGWPLLDVRLPSFPPAFR